MKEVDLRRWHRAIGIIAVLFIILQAGSGFLISLSQLSVPHTPAHENTYSTGHAHEEGDSLWHDALVFVHLGGGIIGIIYRILLGIGIVMMAVSGSTILFKARARSRKS